MGCLSNSVSATAQLSTIDPTRPFGQGVVSTNGEQAVNSLVLQSIVHGDGIHTAVINGKVIKPGEYIGQYQLVAINDASVVLRSDDERLTLNVFKQRIIK